MAAAFVEFGTVSTSITATGCSNPLGKPAIARKAAVRAYSTKSTIAFKHGGFAKFAARLRCSGPIIERRRKTAAV